VPPNRISAIVNAERAITADTALRLAKALGTTPDLWLNLQKRYDLDCARDAVKDPARIDPIRARAGG
jgi:addiction module HigA family antidote